MLWLNRHSKKSDKISQFFFCIPGGKVLVFCAGFGTDFEMEVPAPGAKCLSNPGISGIHLPVLY